MNTHNFLPGLLLSVCWCGVSFAQPRYLPFKHLTQYDELFQQDNQYVFQDSRGYTWISAVSGLNRFNGTEVRRYAPDRSDPCAITGHNITSPFFEDEAANIWFTTYEGLNCWNRKNDCFSYHPLKDTTGRPIDADNLLFARDEAGRFWILSRNGSLYTYHPGGEQHRIAANLNTAKCFAGFEKERLRYVFFYQHRINKLGVFTIGQGTMSQKKFYTPDALNLPFKKLRVNSMLYMGNDTLWMASDKGLIRLNLSDLTKNELVGSPGTELEFAL